jgi:peptidyl-prolyl cis-trans isomerase SurA
MPTPFALASLCALLALPPPPMAAPPPTPATEQPTLKDRVVAIVDEDPILSSDIDRVVGLGLAAAKPGESDHDFRRRVLSQLIDQRLRFHEIDRFGLEQVPVALVDQDVKEIHDRFSSEDAFRKRLKEVGLTQAGLRQLVTRQLMVLTYVDERLGPKVFVSQEDIEAHYRDVLTPELKRQNQPVPPLGEVREQIRAVLKENRLNEEIDRWTDELRKKADILNYFDDQGKPLPPVVKRIEKKKPVH